MGLISRTLEILQAKYSRLLNRAENPSDTLDLSYEKMLTGLQDTKRSLADVVTQQRSLQKQIEVAQAQAGEAEATRGWRCRTAARTLPRRRWARSRRRLPSWKRCRGRTRPSSSNRTS